MSQFRNDLYDELHSANNPPSNKDFLFSNSNNNELDINYGLTDYGQDITDNSFLSSDYDWYTGVDSNEDRAQGQSWGSKASRGLARIGSEFTLNTLDTAAMLGAAIGNIGQDDWLEKTVNNSVSLALEEAKEYFNSELAPVYVKKAVKNGDIWDNISSIDFWATEGASGIAFMAGAMVPGGVLKGLGVGAKMAKLGVGGAKALSKSKSTLQTLKKLDKTMKAISGGKLSATPDKIKGFMDLTSATAVNTLFEAGVEARGAGEAYVHDLDKRLAADEIDQDTYDKLLAKKSEQMAKVFNTNMALLILPNAIMNKALLGRIKPKSQVGKFNISEGKITSNLEGLTKKQMAGNISKKIGKVVGTSFASEGFLEEAGQMTAEHYNTSGFLDRELGVKDKSIAETYMDVVKSTEGQKAIFLGGVLGSGMMGYQAGKQYNADKKHRKDLAEVMTKGANLFESIQRGLIDPQTGELDPYLAGKLGDDVGKYRMGELMEEMISKQASEGDMVAKDTLDALQHANLNRIITSFASTGQDGVEILKNYLETSSGLDSHLEKYNEDREVKKTKDDYLSEITEEATQMSEDIEFFREFNQLFKKNISENEKSTDERYQEFQHQNLQTYAKNSAMVRYYDKKLSELSNLKNKAWSNHVKRYGKDGKLEGREDDLSIGGKAINSFRERIKEAELQQKEHLKMLEELEDSDKQKEKYKKFINKEHKLKEDKKDQEELDTVFEKIDKSLSPTELDNDFKEHPLYSKYKKSFDDKIEERKNFLENQKRQEAEEAAKKAAEEAQVTNNNNSSLNEEIDSIIGNINPGEPINLSKYPELAKKIEELGLSSKNYFYAPYQNGISVATDTGEFYNIEKENIENGSDVYNTEGSENIESTKDNKTRSEETNSENLETNKKDYDVDLLSTNRETGELLYDFLKDYLDYERNGVDKIGNEVKFEIGNFNEKAFKLYQKYIKGDTITETQLDYLIDNIVIKIKISDNISTVISAKPNTQNQNSLSKYENRTRKLRENLLNALKENDINSLYGTIKGQYHGKINVEGGKEVKNNVLDIKGIKSISDVKLYVIDENGLLKDFNGDIPAFLLGEKSQNWKGAIYMPIPQANGKPFLLQLNFDKVQENQASIIYDIYEQRLKRNVVHQDTLDKLPKELQDQIKNELKNELNFFKTLGKKFKDITISELTDILAYDGSTSPKAMMKVTLEDKNELLHFGENKINISELNDEVKEQFVDWITKNKNRNVKFKSKNNEDGRINLSNIDYLKYIIENNVLNSNINTKEPFTGFTNIFIGTDVHNVNKPLEATTAVNTESSSTLKKDNTQSNNTVNDIIDNIQKEATAVTTEVRTINGEEQSVYVKDGKVYERQSNFVDRVLDTKQARTIHMDMGATVGNLIDIVARDVFGNDIKSYDDYIKEVNEINKENGFPISINEILFNNLVKKLNSIKESLAKQGMTFYSKDFFVKSEYNEKAKKATGFEGVAGTLDLVAVDPNGKLHIIDFKSTKINSKSAENKIKDDTLLTADFNKDDNKMLKWSIQQSIYSELTDRYGLDVSSINILSFASSYEKLANGSLEIQNLEFMSDKLNIKKSNLDSKLIKLVYNMDMTGKLRDNITLKDIKETSNILPSQKKVVSLPKPKRGRERPSSKSMGNKPLTMKTVNLKNQKPTSKKPNCKQI